MNQTPLYRWFCFFLGGQGLVALLWLFSIPSEGARISLARLALAGILLGLTGFWFWLGQRRAAFLQKFTEQPVWLMLSLGAAGLAVALFLLRYLDPGRFLPIYERLSPLIWYLLLAVLQLITFPAVFAGKVQPSRMVHFQALYRLAAKIMLALLFIFIFVAITRLGLTRDPIYWGEPGVPLQVWQFLFALLLGMGVFYISAYERFSWLDFAIPISIYLFALVLWLNTPIDVLKNSFYMPIAAPDMQPYPYSDSSYYDRMAQSLLIGHPYQGVIPTRPLYVAFLTLLHLFVGENYPHILAVQTIVLATLPLVLYLIGRYLHSRAAGVVMATFFIFRELTSQWIASETRVTNTKMLLVDLPTLLLLLLVLLLVLRWLTQRTPQAAMVAGAAFGLLLLLRTQSLLVLPFILLVAVLQIGWRDKALYVQFGLYFLGLSLAIAPWLLHNYLQTGVLAMDADFQLSLLASQYAANSNLDLTQVDLEGKGLFSVLLFFLVNDPMHVLGFVSNHFLATLTNSLLVLPLLQSFESLRAPINLYWMDWNGSLAWYNVVLLMGYLGVIAFGLGAAWKRWRWIGLLPLAVSLGYMLATALSRFSSWRYDFPADWVAYFYFAIGFAEYLLHIAVLFGGSEPDRESDYLLHSYSNSGARTIFILVLLVLTGSLPWLLEGIATPRYADQSPAALVAKIQTIPQAPSATELDAFVDQPGSFLQIGRLLYPRFYYKDDGLASANPSPAYLAREYPRLGFLFLNQISYNVVFSTSAAPAPLPHAADVIVLGCQGTDYIEARLIAIPGLGVLHLTPDFQLPCKNE